MELNELNQATPDVTSIDRNEKRGWQSDLYGSGFERIIRTERR